MLILVLVTDIFVYPSVILIYVLTAGYKKYVKCCFFSQKYDLIKDVCVEKWKIVGRKNWRYNQTKCMRSCIDIFMRVLTAKQF